MPPGSGVPVPGANAGSRTSTSTVRNTGPLPTAATVRSTTSPDAELADVVHEERRDPVLALPCELRLAGPVAAQPDLDVAAPVDVPVADEAVHRRPVRELDAEDLRARVGVRVEVDETDGAVPRGHRADVRLRDRVVASEDQRARLPRRRPGRRSFDLRMRAHRIGRNDRGIPEVDDAQLGERVDPGLEVGPGRAARSADRARPEARARPVGDEVVGRRADDRDVDAVRARRGSCVYGMPAYVSRPA